MGRSPLWGSRLLWRRGGNPPAPSGETGTGASKFFGAAGYCLPAMPGSDLLTSVGKFLGHSKAGIPGFLHRFSTPPPCWYTDDFMLSQLGFFLSAIGVGVCPAFAGSIVAGQESQPRVAITPRNTNSTSGSSRSNIRLDVKVVLVPVTVTDVRDRPVTSLPQDSFRVLEDAVEQRITSFTREDAPVSLGLLFDSSGSMKNRIATSTEALRQVFQTTLPGDEFFVVQFSDRAHLLGGFTTEPEEIYRRLGVVEAQGWTALLDAIALGAHQMRSAKNQSRVLLILSDGNDNNSRFSESEIRSLVIESDLRVYAIGLGYRPRLLEQLAELTGGRVLVAQHIGELPDVVQRLSAEIRSQYLLGYSSRNPQNDGKYHKVKVELVQPAGAPPLRTSWRRGYYAPGQ